MYGPNGSKSNKYSELICLMADIHNVDLSRMGAVREIYEDPIGPL
jgi:hypothetical protein